VAGCFERGVETLVAAVSSDGHYCGLLFQPLLWAFVFHFVPAFGLFIEDKLVLSNYI
jgi:hypothetical protein